MTDFRNPASIRAWLAIAPDRHRQQMRALYRLPAFAEFRAAMVEAAR